MIKQTLIAAVLLTFSATAAQAADPAFASDTDKLSYSLGMLIGDRVLKQYENLNYALLVEAMKAQHGGTETQISLSDAGEAVQAFHTQKAQAKNAEAREASIKYLQDNALRKEVTITESGLQYEVLTEAEGKKPAAEDTVKVHYRGTLIDGSEFDSSYSRNEPAEFPLNRVIAGWTEGLQLMSIGSKFRFVIPSELAYGERGSSDKIPGGAALVFEVELLEIKPAAQ